MNLPSPPGRGDRGEGPDEANGRGGREPSPPTLRPEEDENDGVAFAARRDPPDPLAPRESDDPGTIPQDPATAHRELIANLYLALDRRDGGTMAASYAPNAEFRDPVFELAGGRVALMWRMLCARATDLRCEARDIEADERTGRARWRATYTFAASGRRVVNDVTSRFEFADGLIVRQVDTFDFWRWSRQALGVPGWLLGWSGWLRGKVRRQAEAQLARFESQRAAEPMRAD